MVTFEEILADPARRQALLEDCSVLLEKEINAHKGVMAKVVRMSFHQVRKLEGGHLIENVFDKLLQEFVDAVIPLHQKYMSLQHAGVQGSFEDFINLHADDLAAALLEVSDRERDRVDNAFLVMVYNRMRGAANGLILASVPSIALFLDCHVNGRRFAG